PEVIAFLDAKPVFPGHTLIVPHQHLETLEEVDDELAGKLLSAGRRVAAAQRVALGADGSFLGLNDRVSQSVPHVHLHVVPRRRGDGLRGFFWPRVRYEHADHAAQVAAALRGALAGSAQ
ncbi:MAG: HIT family protein, partial [Acidimicrobiales bacterium]